ncbi:hypothetical protein [Teredinibacter turnerae]|uniref:hypothetical protein n=1 Tax=Teredinibacter turnerae TaxID=2426 RepID=UPI00035DB74F|nr:hypothetical protein [Teredinibacter turnerae]
MNKLPIGFVHNIERGVLNRVLSRKPLGQKMRRSCTDVDHLKGVFVTLECLIGPTFMV